MNAVQATEVILELMNAATQALITAQGVSDLIKKAKAENRDITKEELDGVVKFDDDARLALEAAIKSAQG